MENDAIEGRLLALEFVLGQLIKPLPQSQKDALFAEASTHFTSHHHRPNLDSEAMVVVKNAFGRPGPG